MNTMMNLKNIQIPSSQTVISTAASVAATAMLVRSLARDYIPSDLQNYIHSKFHSFFTKFSTQVTLIFDEFVGFSYNHVFKAVEIYLRPTLSHNTKRFRVIMPQKENKIAVIMERNQEMVDTFKGIQLKWRLVSQQIEGKYISNSTTGRYDSIFKSELRYFELSFNRKHKNKVLNEYLPYVLHKSKEVKEERKTLKLFTLHSGRMLGMRGSLWQSVNLDHPATFDTLAMDLEMKKMIMEDLDKFVSGKEFYRKVGKAWKRGYLLFGPPGTGKSSLIAAMANYLNFDIYDLELTDVKRNSELRKLLMTTSNRSIVVVEDIDCSIDLQNRTTEAIVPDSYPFSEERTQVTLSGLLNFIDGLWSSCGDERIIVFTTNHKEKLDPALVRPGRMDMHIHMSYCTPCGFRLLASNYLRAINHPLVEQIEKMIETVNVTPAEVGEQMLKYEDSELALNSLIDFLREKERLVAKGQLEGLEIEEKGRNLLTGK